MREFFHLKEKFFCKNDFFFVILRLQKINVMNQIKSLCIFFSIYGLQLSAQSLESAPGKKDRLPTIDPESGRAIVYIQPGQPVPADVLEEFMPIYRIHPDYQVGLSEEEIQAKAYEEKAAYYKAQGLDYFSGKPLNAIEQNNGQESQKVSSDSKEHEKIDIPTLLKMVRPDTPEIRNVWLRVFNGGANTEDIEFLKNVLQSQIK